MLGIGLLLISMTAPESSVVQSPYWHVEVAEGAIRSLRYDARGEADYGTELAWRPLTVVHDDAAVAVWPEHVSLSEDGQILHITPGMRGARLRWFVDCSPDGYYDRLTRQSLNIGPEEAAVSQRRIGCRQSNTVPELTYEGMPETPALVTFVSGGKGHYIVVEAFKRVAAEQLNSGALYALARHANPGHTTIIETADEHWIRVAHQPGRGTRFAFDDNRLVAEFILSDTGLSLRPYDAHQGIRLDDGAHLPHFCFGANVTVENSLGGKRSLNDLFNEFYRQAAFWYPNGHGISAWAAWGGLGHAYMNSPYRVDSRNSLMGQVISDDGHGNDGYAWSWGDQRGWPFPREYDTRHFGINAMHIVGAQGHLGWSGEYKQVAGIDFGVRGYANDVRVYTSGSTAAPRPLARHQTYSQHFTLEDEADRIALSLTVASQDTLDQDQVLEQRHFYPDLPREVRGHLPQRLAEAPGGVAAQRFTAQGDFDTVGVFSCSWSTPRNKMRMRLFRWREDYETTVAGELIGSDCVLDVKDNAFSFLTLHREYPRGTDLLLVLDKPEPAPDGDVATAGFWVYPAPKEHPALFLGGKEEAPCRALSACGQGVALSRLNCEAMTWYCMRTITGIQRLPIIKVRIVNEQGMELYDQTHTLPFPGDAGGREFSVETPLPQGRYTVHLVSTGSPVSWNASRSPATPGGAARYNGSGWSWLERCRRAMRYQLDTLHGEREGMLLLDGNHGDGDHTGVSGVSVGNNYYDILPFGYLDAYANAWFYDSLRAMAALERAHGYPEEAARYESLRRTVKARYNELFWTESGHVDGAARYLGCIDAAGQHHDYGFSFVNTLATSVGLADPVRARAIVTWLDTGSAYNAAGQKEALYHYQFGPRTTTIDNPRWWAVEQHYENHPWGAQIQNGGANLYESYYDLQTRLFAHGADDAYARFLAILQRYAEPDRLTGGGPLFTGDTVQGGGTPGATGVMSYEFPETAMLAAIVVYGFLGADVDAAGLHVRPRIPEAQPFIRAENLYYHGSYFDIEARKDVIRIRTRPDEERYHYRIGTELLAPPFEHESPYDSNDGICITPISVNEK